MTGKPTTQVGRAVLAAGLLLLLAIAPASAAQPNFPDLIQLPAGFQPEGIASGRGTSFFTGSLTAAGVYRGDFRTGEGGVFIPGNGRTHVGMKVDPRTNYLFVAGGPSGQAFVYDAGTGDEMRVLNAPVGGFVNDVVVTRTAAYFTNSAAPVFFRLALGSGGTLPGTAELEAVNLSGDWEQVPGFNGNGIDATPDGSRLIIVNSAVGKLYLVDPATGYADAIELQGGDGNVRSGDGILLDGKTLYVLQNRLNRIAVISMAPDYASGVISRYITDSDFNVPTTLAEIGNSLYAVNAKFGTPPGPTIPYEAVKVSK
jgi:hypothetical protein